MRRILSTLLVLGMLLAFVGSVFAKDVYVNGYYRSNGTYVQPYYRTSPDSSILNNYSTDGNSNPYTESQFMQDLNNKCGDTTINHDWSQPGRSLFSTGGHGSTGQSLLHPKYFGSTGSSLLGN